MCWKAGEIGADFLSPLCVLGRLGFCCHPSISVSPSALHPIIQSKYVMQCNVSDRPPLLNARVQLVILADGV